MQCEVYSRHGTKVGAVRSINFRHNFFYIKGILTQEKPSVGSGVDFILETSGNSTIYQIAVAVLNPRGTLANIAQSRVQDKLPGEKKSVRVTMGSSVPQKFIPELISFYQAGVFPFDRLEKFYNFSEINQAIADSKSGITIKPVLRINRE